ncbi:MAG: hypothetical protein AB8F94_23355 [Saprospiraceae bacterium]
MLSKIDESELKFLIKFAKSPYHNTNKLIVPLLQKILTYSPGFDHKKLTKEHLYHAIHPEGKAYHDGRMNLLMTNLVSVIQDFYMYQEFQKDKILQRRLKGKAYSNRNLYKNYKKEVEGILVDLEKSPYREEAYFFQRYDVQEEIYFHIETDRNQESKNYLYSAQEALDHFYIIAKLRLAAEQITMVKRLNTSIEIRFLEMLLNDLEKQSSLPLITNIYNKIIRLRRDENSKEFYHEIEKILFSNLDGINLSSQKLIYLNMVNYGVGKLNQGNKETFKELFVLFKFGLRQGYSMNNNCMTVVTYINISMVSINLKEFEWGYDFIISYEKYLPLKEAYLTKLMTLASWHYSVGVEKDYEHFYKTLELLREITYNKKNIFIYIRSKILWIRTTYDLLKYDPSYYSTLMDYIKSFESHLKKNTILSSELIQRYFSFNFCVKKIAKLHRKNDISEKDIKKLNDDIRSQKSVAAKNWINEKVEELRTPPLKT